MPSSHRGTAAAPAGRAPHVDRPELLRNVALVGHTGAGKTTLTEALLAAAGTIPRPGRVEEGTTVTDYDDMEIRAQRSVSLAVAPLEHAGIKVNLLDTPGYADFVGDLRAGLRAADAALFVVSALDGVDGGTRLLWEECAALSVPRAVVVTKLDRERADFDEAVAVCQRVFGEGVLPLYLPALGDDDVVAGLIGLISRRVYDYSSGQRVEREADPEHLNALESARNALIEAIIAESEDETLMDRYLAGEDIDEKVLVSDLEKAVTRGTLYPVLPVAAPRGVGIAEVLQLVTAGFPSPAERPSPTVTAPDGTPRAPLAAEPDGPLAAQVIKTTTDPYVGRVSLVRVFSGTVRPDQPVHVCGAGRSTPPGSSTTLRETDERVGTLASPLGRTLRPVELAVAGDIVAVAKLSHAETGDTLSSPENPLLIEPWLTPEPLLPVALTARTRGDEDKMSEALARLVTEDPTLRLEVDTQTHQMVLWAMGEAHVEVVLDRLRHRFGVEVDPAPVRVALRETFAGPARGHGRHVKQSGGHGQFAICDIDVEPLPSGSGFEFVDKVVGGAVPRQFIPSVEKGVRAQMERGVAAGYPVVDLRVSLVDGKAHPVDSSDMAFQTAGALALKDAASHTTVLLLEPVDEVTVLVDDEYLGTVMSDLAGRRGRVLGSEPVGGHGRSVVHAEVPEVELTRYAVDLRSLSHGTGTFERRYVRHEPMPSGLAAKIVAQAQSGTGVGATADG